MKVEVPHAASFANHWFSVMEYSSGLLFSIETLTLAFSWYFMYGYDVADLNVCHVCNKVHPSEKLLT